MEQTLFFVDALLTPLRRLAALLIILAGNRMNISSLRTHLWLGISSSAPRM
jgi:hypothetical protein